MARFEAQIFRVLAPVPDIEAAEAFYAELFGSPGRRVSPGRHYFDCGDTILACFDPMADGEGRVARPNPEPIYLAVEDLARCYRACREAGARFSEESKPGVGPLGRIAVRPWGEESFYAEDPFGNALCFVRRETAFRG